MLDQVSEVAEPSEHNSPTARGRLRGPQGPRIRTTGTTTTLLQSPFSSEDSSEILSPLTPPISPLKITEFTGTGTRSSHGSDTGPPTVAQAPLTQVPAEVAPAAVVKVSTPKFSPLTLPPKINFETTSISYKGLPLEAAQWSFSSHELQQIVSRAIRLSSQESFIRLLSLENIDQNIPQELERLDHLRAVTQSKYRFHTHRRNMLLQGLNSIAMSASGKSHTDTAEVVGRLTAQLSENTADGDRLTEELLLIADQQAQLTKVQDAHCASALAVALRKLHKSYAKRTKELVDAKEQITRLEGELDDAWQEAERMAQEMDQTDTGLIGSDYEDEIDIEIAEIVAVHRRTASNPIPVSDGVTVRSTSNRSDRISAAKKRSSRASSLRPPRKAGGSRPAFGGDQDVQSPVVPPVPKLVEIPSQRPVPQQGPGPSFLSMTPTTSEVHVHIIPSQENSSVPETVPHPVMDDKNDALSRSPPDSFADPQTSPQSSEFDDSQIPPIWLQSDVLQPKARIRSLMTLGTSQVDAERTRPTSSVLSRVPSFDSARAVSYDSDGMISYGSGGIVLRDSEGASLPVLQPNRNASSDYVSDAPSGVLRFSSSKTMMSSSSSDRVLSPYTKLKTLTKRYTLPFRGGGREKSYTPPLPPPPPPQPQ